MAEEHGWRERLERLLPLYGHRNWVVVSDAAYPAQVGAMEVLATGKEHLMVLRDVVSALRRARHVRPIVWLDAELDALTETMAPGVEATRDGLAAVLRELSPSPVLHAELIERLGAAAQSFNVLVLKTTCTVPYSSVFIELDCGYWSAEQEAELRRAMAAGDVA
ncbi:MAG TPA: hypothetical protein VK689_14435 [Armatimonadota bacterium]|nr:hypothetical protein [Armatimonadota bacterium]